MAAKNSRKLYMEEGYYHIYNRGVEKRNIYLDLQDYGVFLSYLKEYLSPKDEQALFEKLANPNTSYKERDKILKLLRLNNFHGEIFLMAYCLMPNHFHLMIKQSSAISIDKFMNSLALRYAIYFNRKYKRTGKLFQDVYKAVSLETDEQLLHLSRYIHQNPLNKNKPIKKYTISDFLSQPSSYPEYLGHRKSDWVTTDIILGYFSKTNSNLTYKSFVEKNEDITLIQDHLLD
ncbi:transposase [Candidatus Daviesbacteria bacterium]|nr:transposase [Candidatus Daviesbacteria bacterium]